MTKELTLTKEDIKDTARLNFLDYNLGPNFSMSISSIPGALFKGKSVREAIDAAIIANDPVNWADA